MSDQPSGGSVPPALSDTRDAAYFKTLLGNWSQGKGPLYARLADSFKEAITWRKLQVGDFIPSERQLAAELNVARSTVIRAYDILREQGIVESRRGSGSWVAATAETLALERRILDGLSNAAPPSDAHTIDLATASFGADQAVYEEISRLAGPSLWAVLEGPGYSVAGDWGLRSSIAEMLTTEGLPTEPTQVLVTSGAQQSISLIVRRFVDAGDIVVVEDPTSAGALDIFSEVRAVIRAAVGDAANNPDDLINLIRRSRPTLAHLAVPGGVHGVMANEEALRDIANAAAASQCLLVEDASSRDLSHRPCPPFLATLTDAPVLTLGSMSKLFWGGLRVGWIRGPESLIEALTRTKARADLGSSTLSQLVAIALFQRREEIRARRLAHLRENLDLATEILRAQAPDLVWDEPDTGLTLWVGLPHGTSSRLVTIAERHGVRVTGGEAFSFSGRSGDHIRISLAPPPELFVAGLQRLVSAWKALDEERPSQQHTNQPTTPYAKGRDGLI